MTCDIHASCNGTAARRSRHAADARLRAAIDAKLWLDPAALDRLSPRQLVLMRALAAGIGYGDAAEILGSSEDSVKQSCRLAYAALGIEGDSPGKAAVVAFALGQLEGRRKET